MSGRKRKAVFDPSAVKDKVIRRKDASHDLILHAQQFIDAVSLLSAEDVEYVCSKCNDITVQLVLTAKVGLNGCEAVKFAYSHVPEGFLSNRESRVQEIVTEATCEPPQLMDSRLCQSVATVLETRFPRYWMRKPLSSAYLPEMKRLTERHGASYFRFLSPPIHKCISPGCAGVLAPNHAPINVVVFTVYGPIAATKVSLRCRACSMVYNYNMYGNKQGEGEMLYPSERSLVEVSDTMYVERNVYELFCSLRSVGVTVSIIMHVCMQVYTLPIFTCTLYCISTLAYIDSRDILVHTDLHGFHM